MSKPKESEYATAEVPTSVWVAEPRHTADVEDDAFGVSQKIGAGRAFLKVVAYPWGVEFEVCETEKGA